MGYMVSSCASEVTRIGYRAGWNSRTGERDYDGDDSTIDIPVTVDFSPPSLRVFAHQTTRQTTPTCYQTLGKLTLRGSPANFTLSITTDSIGRTTSCFLCDCGRLVYRKYSEGRGDHRRVLLVVGVVPSPYFKFSTLISPQRYRPPHPFPHG